MELLDTSSPERELYRWQLDALISWLRCGRRGVIEAVTDLLLPFFGGICYRYGFEQAIADGVCAAPRVAFVGVPLSVDEQAEYAAVEQRLVGARQHLRSVRDMPLEPFGDFLAAVAHL